MMFARRLHFVPNLVGLLLLLQVGSVFASCAESMLGSLVVRCRYSVRDVAFVNVHGKPWQLQLVKPVDVNETLFARWNEALQAKLERTNIGYIWLAPNSERADEIVARLHNSNMSLPAMALSGPEEQMIPMSSGSFQDLSLEEKLDSLVNSSGRREILEAVVDSLCVVVLVESADENANREARNAVKAAVERVDRRMWTLEKPTDKGPQAIVIQHRQLADEEWLLKSLEISDQDLPAVAIVYGQGRRLGNVLVGEDLNADEIMGRASICGRDCECSLDRKWLYGRQLIHVWDDELERSVEQSLSFDPHSAFVIAEVAQIIQKNSNGGEPLDRVDLGSGLVIHDLDDLGKKQIENEGPSPAAEQDKTAIQDATSRNPSLPSEGDDENQELPITVPWPLLLGLVVVAFMILGFLNRR